MHPDEKQAQAVLVLCDAVAYYARLGITAQRLLTENGPAFRSREFKATCIELGIKHSFTRPYRPQTNGKAERIIQPAFREWAHGRTYQNSAHRSMPWEAGSTATAGIARTAASAASRRCPYSTRQEKTS